MQGAILDFAQGMSHIEIMGGPYADGLAEGP